MVDEKKLTPKQRVLAVYPNMKAKPYPHGGWSIAHWTTDPASLEIIGSADTAAGAWAYAANNLADENGPGIMGNFNADGEFIVGIDPASPDGDKSMQVTVEMRDGVMHVIDVREIKEKKHHADPQVNNLIAAGVDPGHAIRTVKNNNAHADWRDPANILHNTKKLGAFGKPKKPSIPKGYVQYQPKPKFRK